MFKKTIILTAADTLSKILGLLLIPLFLNFMPKEDFGEYSFIIVVIASLPTLITLGLHVSLVKEFCSESDISSQRNIFSSTLIIALIFSSCLSFFLYSLGVIGYAFDLFFSINQNSEIKELLFSFYIVSSCIGLILYSLALSLKNVKTLIFFSSVKVILINGAGIFFLKIGFSDDTSLSRLLGTVIGDVVSNMLFFFIFCRKFWVWKFDNKYLVKALNLGYPLIPAGIAVLISSSSDRYFINKYYDNTYVAEYSLAMLCVSPIHMIMTSAQTVLAPIVLSFKNNTEEYQFSIKFFIKFLFLLIPIIFLIQGVIYLARLYSLIPSFYEYLNLFSLLLSFQTATFVFLQVPYNIFIKHNKSKYIAFVSIGSALFTVLTGYFTTPLFGLNGLMISNSCINFFFLIGCFAIAKKIAMSNEMHQVVV